MRSLTTPQYVEALQEAMGQSGKLLVIIFCRPHGEECGRVRTSDGGPVLIERSRNLGPDAQWITDKRAVRARGVPEPRAKPMIARDGYLFDHQDRPVRPTVWCPKCGEIEFDVPALRQTVDAAYREGRRKHVV